MKETRKTATTRMRSSTSTSSTKNTTYIQHTRAIETIAMHPPVEIYSSRPKRMKKSSRRRRTKRISLFFWKNSSMIAQ